MTLGPEPVNKLDRIISIITLLSGNRYGLTIEEIAERMNRDERTIRRDLKEIENYFDTTIKRERGFDRKYRYTIDSKSVFFKPILFKVPEIIALYFIRGFAHFGDIPFIQSKLDSVFEKIHSQADEKSNPQEDPFKRVSDLFISPRALSGRVSTEQMKTELLEKLINSALEYRVCSVTYTKDDNEREHRIGVLHFFNYRDALYLLARNIEKSQEMNRLIYINLALHRIINVEELDESFEYPDDFDASEFFKSDIFCFDEDKVNIKLRFPPHLSDYMLRRNWFPDQNSVKQADGSLIMEFESDVNMILKGWIRGFGPDVEVLEPESLRDEMINDLRENLKLYGRG